MPDEEFDRDLARRLRSYESRVPDADAPDVDSLAERRNTRWPLPAGGVVAAVAAGGLTAFLLLNLPWGNAGDPTPLPSPTATPEGIVQLSLDDPRRDCVGNETQLLAVYRIPNGEAFWALFPEVGLAPEILAEDAPLIVVVYDGIYPGAIFGGLRPAASGEPVPTPRLAPAEGTVDVCVETLDGSGGQATIGVYPEIPLAGSLIASAVESPEPSTTASPPPVPALTADGTPGVPVSWCWDGECIDGSLDFEDLDRYLGVGTYFSLESEGVITRFEATAYASAGEPLQLDVSNNEIHVWGAEPRIVLVRAEFEGGGEVSYAWRMARQIVVGVGADHVAISEPLVEVTPPRGPDDAMVRVEYTDPEMLGIEGVAQFLKATTPQGTVVLDRIVGQDGGQERIPPGAYVLTAYYRACDGNCDVLDPPESFCSVDAVVAPNDTFQLVVSIGRRSCQTSQETDPSE